MMLACSKLQKEIKTLREAVPRSWDVYNWG